MLAVEASRLARNGRDWHTLLEFCAFVNSLIIDEDGMLIKLINDRLLLGMKGTFSELERRFSANVRRRHCVSRPSAAICTRRSLSATCAAPMTGWRKIPIGASAKRCPWCSASSTRSVAFDRWRCGCARADRAAVVAHAPQGRIVEWCLPRYNTVHRLLTNPVYAGAYVFGRTGSRVQFEGGRKVISHGIRRRRDDWGC